MSFNVLSNRDANTQIKPASTVETETEKPKTLEYHRQDLQSRIGNKTTQQNEQFVSPSDEIMSPATRKLSAHRGRNLLKNSKPKTLFQKTSSKKYEAAKDANTFEDVPKNQAEGEKTPEQS